MPKDNFELIWMFINWYAMFNYYTWLWITMQYYELLGGMTIMMTMGLTQLYHLIIHECCWMLFKVLARLSSIYQGRFSRLWYLIVKRSSSRCLCFICYFPSVIALQSLNIWFKEISIVWLLRVKAHINCTLFWNICLTTAYTSFIIYRDFINSFFNLRPFFHSLTPLDQS